MAAFHPRSAREQVHSLVPKQGDKAYVCFENRTKYTVDVVWIDFAGKYVTMRTLDSGAFVDVNTYCCHPWKAVVRHTLEEMAINNKPVYYPKTPLTLLAEYEREQHQRGNVARLSPGNNVRNIVRPKAIITRPMYSLLENSMEVIMHRLQDPDKADLLELPRVLAEGLKAEMAYRREITRVVEQR